MMEVKQEINQIINTLPQDVLGDLLRYLKQIKNTEIGKERTALNLRSIINEDKELLERLAQ